jgi:hypothetical protein
MSLMNACNKLLKSAICLVKQIVCSTDAIRTCTNFGTIFDHMPQHMIARGQKAVSLAIVTIIL